MFCKSKVFFLYLQDECENRRIVEARIGSAMGVGRFSTPYGFRTVGIRNPAGVSAGFAYIRGFRCLPVRRGESGHSRPGSVSRHRAGHGHVFFCGRRGADASVAREHIPGGEFGHRSAYAFVGRPRPVGRTGCAAAQRHAHGAGPLSGLPRRHGMGGIHGRGGASPECRGTTAVSAGIPLYASSTWSERKRSFRLPVIVSAPLRAIAAHTTATASDSRRFTILSEPGHASPASHWPAKNDGCRKSRGRPTAATDAAMKARDGANGR